MRETETSLVPMGPHTLVRQKPNGAVQSGRQVAHVMSLFGCTLKIGDWVVSSGEPDEMAQDEDLSVVRKDVFEREWEVLGLNAVEDRPC